MDKMEIRKNGRKIDLMERYTTLWSDLSGHTESVMDNPPDEEVSLEEDGISVVFIKDGKEVMKIENQEIILED